MFSCSFAAFILSPSNKIKEQCGVDHNRKHYRYDNHIHSVHAGSPCPMAKDSFPRAEYETEASQMPGAGAPTQPSRRVKSG